MVNDKKLAVMLSEHKSRCTEVEELLGRKLKKITFPLSEEEFRSIFNKGVKFYRHVGAIWILEGILHGTVHEWNETGKPPVDSE